MGKSTLRTVKNYTKGYSEVQTKVREATSNDAWGPSGTQMNEVAQMTYNQQDFVEVMEMLDKRLNDKGKNWRHVFKSLTVLDYILHAGSENVVLYFRENLYIVKTLKEFVYVDEDGKDQGQNVRQKAKDITSLLMDEARLKEARRTRANMRERLAGGDTDVAVPDEFLNPRSGRSSRTTPQPDRQQRRGGTSREDEDLRRAIEESKRMAESEGRPRPSNNGDDDLEKALRLSREEDEKRRRMTESSSALFDEQQEARDSLIDFNGQNNQQMMPQQTGMMPQFTGMPQFNSYNPYAAQQQAQQEEYMRMQQQLEMQRQMEEQAQMQAMMQQQAYLQQQQQLQAQQQMQQMQFMQQQQQPLVAQPTAFGSNNPFASFSSPSPAPQPVQQPVQSQVTGFAPQRTSPPPPSSSFAPSSPAPKRQNQADSQHANLAAALATGGGIDTFGNAGDLRFGHTNPFNRAQKTGTQQQQQPAQPFFQL